MAALLRSEAKATSASRRDDTSTGANGGGGGSGKTTPAVAHAGSHVSDAAQLTTTTSSAGIPDDDELFELDIALLDGRGDEAAGRRHGRPAAAEDDDDDDAADGHALLANCLLPLRSVSKAVPVDAGCSGTPWWSSTLSSSSYPYSGYYSARRLVCAGSSRRFLSFLGGARPGTATGSSARFCFSRRGFETVGNYYFQRY